MRIATRSTFITWKVRPTTRSRSRSTSGCCESSLAMSRSRASLRSWRSPREAPAMRSTEELRGSSESWASMSAGPRTRTWRRMVASSEPSAGPGVWVGADSSRTSKSTLPKASREPGMATASLTRWPFRKVPLVDPRSRTRTPAPVSSSSACRRDTVGSWIARSLATALPTWYGRPPAMRTEGLPDGATSFKAKRLPPPEGRRRAVRRESTTLLQKGVGTGPKRNTTCPPPGCLTLRSVLPFAGPMAGSLDMWRIRLGVQDAGLSRR